MRRRRFITLFGAAASTWPLGVRAQQPPVPVIGFLHQEAASTVAEYADAFHKGLAEAGYIEGQNVKIEYRWADGHYDRLPELAADLVSRNVAVIAAAFSIAAEAAKSATSTIPICFVVGVDPVKLGLVTSLNHPGGNATGTVILSASIGSKRLGLLHDLLPTLKTIALLVNPVSRFVAEQQSADLQSAAGSFGLRIVRLNASTESEIETAFAAMVEQQVGALIVAPDAFFHERTEQIVALAARNAIPAFYDRRDIVVAGGLMSYGPDMPEIFRQLGTYVGRIVKGNMPNELPVIQPTAFTYVINLKTAKALGVTFPSGLLSIADEVIE